MAPCQLEVGQGFVCFPPIHVAQFLCGYLIMTNISPRTVEKIIMSSASSTFVDRSSCPSHKISRGMPSKKKWNKIKRFFYPAPFTRKRSIVDDCFTGQSYQKLWYYDRMMCEILPRLFCYDSIRHDTLIV